MSPNDEVFDDTVCGRCGAKLPDKIAPGSVQDDGFCSAPCAADSVKPKAILSGMKIIAPSWEGPKGCPIEKHSADCDCGGSGGDR